MSPPATAKDARFYVYVGAAWTGPFRLDEVRQQLGSGQVSGDSYAYDPDDQRHYTVGELLAGSPAEAFTVDTGELPGEASGTRTGTHSLSILDLEEEVQGDGATASVTAAFDEVAAEVRALYRAHLDLVENRAGDTGTALATLRRAQLAATTRLAALAGNDGGRRAFVADLLKVGDYLANREQDAALWDLLAALREGDLGDADATAAAAGAVVGHLASTAEASAGTAPAETGTARRHSTTRRILKGAQGELGATQRDLESVQRAYESMQEQHARELAEARTLLTRAEAARVDLASATAQSEAEVRALAAEIHRLADEVAQAGADSELMREVARLSVELRDSDSGTIAPLAEGVLIRMVDRLRGLAASGPASAAAPEQVARLREELAQVRSELVQARAQALAAQEERERLKAQLEESRKAAEHAAQSARERETRLRTTVAALESAGGTQRALLTDLEHRLADEQERVTATENELEAVRASLQSTRGGIEERAETLMAEQGRTVEMRAMLEGRRNELLAALKETEARIAQARSQGGATAELEAKAAQQRQHAEAAQRRLRNQEEQAARREAELAAGRAEADQLRARSEILGRELEQGRTRLAEARTRFDELKRSLERLDSEREQLAQEAARRGTDALARKDTDAIARAGQVDPGIKPGSARATRMVEQLEQRLAEANRRLEGLNGQLDQERRRASSLSEQHQSMEQRVEELASDRDHLRQELDRLHGEHFAEHSRHAAQLAMSTQATIDAERRYKEAMERVFDLEHHLTELEGGQAGDFDALEPKEPGTALRERTQSLRRELDQARSDHEEARKALEEARERSQRIARGTDADGEQPHDALPEEPAALPAAKADVVIRLAAIEAELASATASRDELHGRLAQTISERDRLTRELARLRNEQESAAVEQRAALKSARDRLIESQARVQELERTLEAARGDQSHPADAAHLATIEARLAEALVEQERLGAETRRLNVELERARAALDHARHGQGGDLAEAAFRLSQEQERFSTITRGLGEAQRAAEEAAQRAAVAEERSRLLEEERTRLNLELERQRVHPATATDSAALQEVLADRERLFAELERTQGELGEVRRRAARAERATLLEGHAAAGRGRLRELEDQLEAARRDLAAAHEATDSMRRQLDEVRAERDRLAAELARIRAEGGDSAGLAEQLRRLRQRLLRARRRIRLLRRQRDAARAAQAEGERGRPFSSRLTPQTGGADGQTAMTARQGAAGGLSSQLERLRAAQREAQAAFAPQASDDTPPAAQAVRGDDLIGAGSSAAQPAVRATAALTRRPIDEHGLPAGNGFTSVFGRPAIPVPTTSATASASAAVATPPTPVRRFSWPLAGILACALAAPIAALAVRPASANGMVAGIITRLPAGIPGTVRPEVSAGSIVHAGDVLALVRNDHPDRSGIDALLARRQALLARQTSLRNELEFAGRSRASELETTEAAQERLERLRSIERETSDLADRLQSITNEITAEEARLSTLAERKLTSAGSGYVRRLMATDGQRVAPDADLVELVDLDSIALEVVVEAGSVVPGGLALIAIGSGRTLPCTVVTVQGEGHSARARVVPDEPALLAALNGQRLRVAFLASDAGPLERAGERLWRPLGW
jgi:chromosome segregation ATPase